MNLRRRRAIRKSGYCPCDHPGQRQFTTKEKVKHESELDEVFYKKTLLWYTGVTMMRERSS